MKNTTMDSSQLQRNYLHLTLKYMTFCVEHIYLSGLEALKETNDRLIMHSKMMVNLLVMP